MLWQNILLKMVQLSGHKMLVNVYIREKGLAERVRKRSMELYQIFSHHLNFLQIYIYNQAYLIFNTPNVQQVILTLISIIYNEESAKDANVREVAETRLKTLLTCTEVHAQPQRLTGSKRAELTSVRFVSKL